jgi:hypothetical protein
MSAKEAATAAKKHRGKGVILFDEGLPGQGQWRHLRKQHPGLITSTGLCAALGGWPNSVKEALLKTADGGLVAPVDPESEQGRIMGRGHGMEDKIVALLSASTPWVVCHHYPGRSADFMVAHPTLLVAASPDGVLDLAATAADRNAYRAEGMWLPTTDNERASLDDLPPFPVRPGASHLPTSMRPLQARFVGLPDVLRRFRNAKAKHCVPWAASAGGVHPILDWADGRRALLEMKCPLTRYKDPGTTQIGHMVQVLTAMALAGVKMSMYVVALTLRDQVPDVVTRWARKGQVRSNLEVLGLLGPVMALDPGVHPDELTDAQIGDLLSTKLAVCPSFGANSFHLDVYLVRAHRPAQLVIFDFARRATPLALRYRLAEEAQRKAICDASTRAMQRAPEAERVAVAAQHDEAMARKRELLTQWTALCAKYTALFGTVWNGGAALTSTSTSTSKSKSASTSTSTSTPSGANKKEGQQQPFIQLLDLSAYQ